jgi:hypothetical protein
MAPYTTQTALELVKELQGKARWSDESLSMRLRRGEPLRIFIERSMMGGSVVYAIWRDDGAIGGFAHRIVSGLATAEAQAVSVEDSLVYRVPDERGARFLAAGFGDGRVPGPEEEYVISMEIWDPDGRLDENGRLVATTYLEVGP